jgi:Sir2 family
MNCLAIVHRADFQNELALLNTEWVNLDAVALPDGDADLDDFDFSSFAMPSCRSCGGILKPDVVFFGENDPRHNVTAAQEAVEQADTMLVVGSSLTTFGSIAASDGPKRTRPSADAQRPR